MFLLTLLFCCCFLCCFIFGSPIQFVYKGVDEILTRSAFHKLLAVGNSHPKRDVHKILQNCWLISDMSIQGMPSPLTLMGSSINWNRLLLSINSSKAGFAQGEFIIFSR